VLQLGGAVDGVADADIAKLLSVSCQRMSQITRQAGFPTPIGRLGRSVVWRRRDIGRWARDHDRDLPL
jgi:hypothetical protein